MTHTLKAKATIHCDTCGCALKRTKSISVVATNKADAIVEAKSKVDAWAETLKGQNCKTCKSILASV